MIKHKNTNIKKDLKRERRKERRGVKKRFEKT
jgi:hypothetical protein